MHEAGNPLILGGDDDAWIGVAIVLVVRSR